MPAVAIVGWLIWLVIIFIGIPVVKFVADIWPFILGLIVVLVIFSMRQPNRSKVKPRAMVQELKLGANKHYRRNDESDPSSMDSIETFRTIRVRKSHGNVGMISSRSQARTGGKTQAPSATRSEFSGTGPGVPTRGLVIMEEPLNKILQGRKTMELRSKHNRQLGPVALIKKGSGKIYAVAEIVESIGPMTFEEFQDHAREHAVEPERQKEVFYENGWNHGWRLKNVKSLKTPVSYIHKGMSQVKLDPYAIDALSRQLTRG